MPAVSVLNISDKTLIIPLQDVYSECEKLLLKYPWLSPLHCFHQSLCPADNCCAEKLVRRCKIVFEFFPKIELIILYWKQHNGTELEGFSVWKDFGKNPTVFTLNQKKFSDFQRCGIQQTIQLPLDCISQSP